MIVYDIPLPRLLKESGETERIIQPISVSIDLRIVPLSYATIELPEGENLPARSYVELFTTMGSAGIFRVRAPRDSYGGDSGTAELEHAISEVGDYLVIGKLDEMKAADSAMRSVWSHYKGNKWQLGTVAALGSGKVALQANYDRVLDVMLSILDQKPDCMMTFDFTTSPWTVNIVERGTTVTAEGRLSRNVESAQIVYDDTDLCTRVYYEVPATEDAWTDYFLTFSEAKTYSAGQYVVKDNKLYRLPNGHRKNVTWENTTKEAVEDSPTTAWTHKDASTLDTYGLIERTVMTGSDYSLQEANKAADVFLDKHKEPSVSVSISAEDLSAITGEELDTFEIGKLFRLVLADYNITIERNITALSWDDVYGRPEDITITLADEEDTTITFLHDVDSGGTGGGGGGGGAKQQDDVWKEYRTDILKNDYRIHLLAERVNEAEDILQQAGIYIDSNGVLIYATDNENNIGSKLNVLADRITSEVSQFENQISVLGSRITQTADSIRTELWNTKQDLRSFIELTAAQLRAEFQGRDQQITSYIEFTSEHLFVQFRDEINSKWSEFELTADHMLARFRDDLNQLTGKLTITAEKTESYHRDSINKYESWLTHTAGEISGVIRRLDSIEGSELMLHADEAWMLVNNVSVTQDGKVKFKNGIYINQNGTYMGVFTTNGESRELTAGLAVELLSDGTTKTKIKADYIDFTGYVTMQQLEANYIKTDELESEIGKITNLVVHNVAADRVTSVGSITGLTVSASQGLSIGGTDTGTRLKDAFVSVEKTSESSGSVTLRFTSASNATSDVTFSKAGLITGSWSGDTFTASLSETGTSSVTTRVDLAAEGAGQTNYTVRAFDRGGQTGNTIKSLNMYLTLDETAKTVSARSGSASGSVAGIIDVSSLYTSGKTDGANGVTLSAGGWENGANVVTASNGKTERITLPSFSYSGGTTFNSQHVTTVYFTTPSVNAPLLSVDIDASSQYTAGSTSGANAVTISAAGWDGGVNVVSASNGKTLNVSLPPFTVSGGDTFTSEHKTTVYFSGGGASSYLASKEVDASSQYTAGQNSVTLDDFTITTGKITANASNGKTKNLTIAQSQAEWDYTAKTKAVTIKAGGIEVLAFDVNGANIWNRGGQTAYVNKSDQTLSFGASVTVSAKYTSAAGNESTPTTDNASCKITAPTPTPVLEFSDFDTTNGTCKAMAYESGYKSTYYSNQVTVSINLGSWSSGSRTISIKAGGTTVAARTLSLPSSLTFSWSNPAQGYVQASVTVGGKTYTGTRKIDPGWM